MDDQEPTAWEEINPTTALVARPAPRSVPLAPWQDPRTALKPASIDDFARELTACLALCGASGMSEDDRREWLVAARGTLAGIPADLLERGCRRARETCDHPSKVVPAILAEVRRAWDWRRESRAEASQPRLPPPSRHLLDRRGETMTEAETEELNQILEHIGATTRYRPDGSRTQVDAQAGKRLADTPRRKPTRADYIALGVDPATLDAISGAQH